MHVCHFRLTIIRSPLLLHFWGMINELVGIPSWQHAVKLLKIRLKSLIQLRVCFLLLCTMLSKGVLNVSEWVTFYYFTIDYKHNSGILSCS